jgi:signal transduction histidine kinase
VAAPTSNDERSLARAFAGFTAAAASLERSYVQLQSELARLRHELADRNRALAESRGENRDMREQLRCRQALAEMSAVLAHEVRNPLASLELFAGLLAGSELQSEPRKWVEHVQAGLRLLGATVNNVLHFIARLHPGGRPPIWGACWNG